MRYAGLKIVACIVLTCAALLGFLIAEDSDGRPGWHGSSVLEISDDQNNVPWQKVTATLDAVANRYHTDIIRVDENFYDGDHLQNVYVASSDPGSDQAERAEGLLAPFGRSPMRQLSVKPFEPDDPLDPRAAYRILGPPDAAQELAAQFADLGLSGTLTPSFSFARVLANYALQSVGVVAALLAGLMALTVGSVLLSTRRYAVWRLHGATVLQMAGRDARNLAPFCTAALLVSGVATSAFLFWYNEWRQFSVFAGFAALAAVSMGIVVMLSYVAAVLTVSATSVLNALNGRMRPGPALVLLYPLRVVAVLLVVPAVAGFANDLTGLTNRESATSHIADVGNSVNLTFPGYRTAEESDRNYEEAGIWIRRIDSSGRAIVMKRESLQDYLPGPAAVDGTELIWVNDTFLARQPVRDVRGSRIGPAPNGTVRVIVPEHLSSFAGAIADRVLGTFTPETLPAGVAVPRAQRLIAADRQNTFVYSTDNQNVDADGFPMNRPMVRDAVIVSLPNGTPLIDDVRLAAWASFHGVVVSPGDVTSSLGRTLPVGSILGMVPVAGVLADNYAAEVRRAISDALMLGLAIVVVVLTATAACLLYAQRRGSTIVAGHIAGRSFLRIHRRALCLEGIVALVVLGWICVDNWGRAREVATYAGIGLPPPPTTAVPDWWRLLPAATASVAAILLFTGLLLIVHRRTIATVSTV